MTHASQFRRRVTYADGQLLTMADLTDEQNYLIGMGQRHVRSQHTWGIAQGLELSMSGDCITISPGVAIDGYGRQLLMPDPVEASISGVEGDEISAWLLYAIEPVGGASAQPGRRLREITSLRLTTGRATDSCKPDSSAGTWPVFLGSIKRADASGAFVVDTEGRQCIGVRGETLRAVSGKAQIRIGEDFAVSLPAVTFAEGDLSAGGTPAEGNDGSLFHDVLRISSSGAFNILADASFTGDFHLNPNPQPTSSSRAGVGFDGVSDPPKGATPWSIYRVEVKRDKLPALDQLVIELQGSQDKADPDGLTAAIGASASQQFKAGLTVNAAGDVTVTGILRVGGRILKSEVAADPSDPRFLLALVNASNGSVAKVDPGSLKAKVTGPDHPVTGKFTYTLTFRNVSASRLDVQHVQELLTLDDQVIAGPVEPIKAFDLHAGATKAFDRQVQVKRPGRLKVGIRATATGADGESLAAKDAIAIQVTQ